MAFGLGFTVGPRIARMFTKKISADERGGTLRINAALVSGVNVIAPLMGSRTEHDIDRNVVNIWPEINPPLTKRYSWLYNERLQP